MCCHCPCRLAAACLPLPDPIPHACCLPAASRPPPAWPPTAACSHAAWLWPDWHVPAAALTDCWPAAAWLLPGCRPCRRPPRWRPAVAAACLSWIAGASGWPRLLIAPITIIVSNILPPHMKTGPPAFFYRHLPARSALLTSNLCHCALNKATCWETTDCSPRSQTVRRPREADLTYRYHCGPPAASAT
jgi:hypothetical protein